MANSRTKRDPDTGVDLLPIGDEEAEHDCCNGSVYYDGRCGDGPIYVHEKSCRRGRREECERRWYDRERR